MSDTIIKVENLSKLYRLGEIGTRLRYTSPGTAGTLSHDMNRLWAKSPKSEHSGDPARTAGLEVGT